MQAEDNERGGREQWAGVTSSRPDNDVPAGMEACSARNKKIRHLGASCFMSLYRSQLLKRVIMSSKAFYDRILCQNSKA
jgi:hypothetical protein